MLRRCDSEHPVDGVAISHAFPEAEVLLFRDAWPADPVLAFRRPSDGRGGETGVFMSALNGWMSLFAFPQLLIVSSVVEHGQIAAVLAPHWTVWVAVLYMALGVTVVGYVIWYRMLARHPVNLMMAFTLLVPVFGVASGHLFLGEPIGWQRIVGGLITIVGVAIIVVRRPQSG